MNRRGFLKRTGLGVTAVVAGPAAMLAQEPKNAPRYLGPECHRETAMKILAVEALGLGPEFRPGDTLRIGFPGGVTEDFILT